MNADSESVGPESSKTRKALTSALQAKNAKPEDKPYRLSAGGGLFLEVGPDGSKCWRFRYTHAGKRGLLSMGLYPEIGLEEARRRRDAARTQVAQGVSPSEHRRVEKEAARLSAANSFEAVAKEWLARLTDKAESTRGKAAWLLQFAIDDFGKCPVNEVTPPMVLAVCRKLEVKDKLETAHRVRSKCGQVFRYAVGTGRADRDPTADLRGTLRTPRVKHRAAITEPEKVGKLLLDIDNYSGGFAVQAALMLSPYVFVRPGELRSAEWSHFDLGDKAEWRFTPPKTRNQTAAELIIPLPKQAVAILEGLKARTGNGQYVFRSWGKEGYLSENAVLAGLRRMGYGPDDMTGHGFRAMARTILDEVLSFPIEIIEQQLAHQVRDMHGRAYNRTKHLPQRREMMQAWANYLDELRAEAKARPETPSGDGC